MTYKKSLSWYWPMLKVEGRTKCAFVQVIKSIYTYVYAHTTYTHMQLHYHPKSLFPQELG